MDFPFPILRNTTNGRTGANKVCYRTRPEATEGTGPCGSWCTKDLNVGSGCGDNNRRGAKHLCGASGHRVDALWLLYQMIREAAAPAPDVKVILAPPCIFH